MRPCISRGRGTGCCWGERLVRARLVVEAREFDDEMSQVLLAEDEDVIERVAS
jgi:hypothetical protein